MPKPAQSNWDDLKFVLAVADQGSVSAAARSLGVNHATVLRRIAAFESRHGLRIFERSAHGYRILADRRPLIEAMRSAGDALGQVERMIEVERPSVSGALRVTSTESFCHVILPRVVSQLAVHIGARVEVLSGNRHLDFARMQADITVRPTMELSADMAGEQAGHLHFGVFAGEGAEARGERWVGLSGPLGRSIAGDWMRAHAPTDAIDVAADSFLAAAAMAAAGGARVLLPTFLGDIWPGLRHDAVPKGLEPVPVWVASHVDFEKSGRLLKARRFLADEISKALGGGGGPAP